MNDTEEDWQDPLLDVSIPYNSLAPYALTCHQLDEDLQDLISFFSTLSKEDLAHHINETSFESSLRILKNVLLAQPSKFVNSSGRELALEQPENVESFQRNPSAASTESQSKLQKNKSAGTDSCLLDPLGGDAMTTNEGVARSDTAGGGLVAAASQVPEGAVQATSSTNKTDIKDEDGKLVDNSKMLITFFKELEAAKLFENLESFSGILAAHSIHLRILQDVVSDIFRVEELRLRLCSQLAALLNPIILSRLESYKNSLFFTAFTVPPSDNPSLNLKGSLNSLPNPIIYKWPSSSTSIEDYKLYMSRLPLLCFSEVFELGSCISKSLKAENNQKTLEPGAEQTIDFSDIYTDECSVRIKSIESIYDHESGPQLDHPLFNVDHGSGNGLSATGSNPIHHHPLCIDIAQDSKDIERDVIYVNGKEYSGANGGYERIIFIVASLVESYWLKLSNVSADSEISSDKEIIAQNSSKTVELCSGSMCNFVNRDLNESYEDRDTDSVIIATILVHILSRTFSGGACFDKVSLVYNKPECIVISPNSKRARPLEMLILPNIALMLSTLRFGLYEVMENLTINTQPCFLVDTHVVSRLIPDSVLIESLPYHSFHILSRTPVGKIPPSIYHHLIKRTNTFLANNVLYTRIKIAKRVDSCAQLETQERAEDERLMQPGSDESSEDPIDLCEKCSGVQNEYREAGRSVHEAVLCNSKCLDTDKIIEVTGDDLTIITPGEAALFRMFTNIQDKDAAHSSIENFNLSNSEIPTNKEAVDGTDHDDHDSSPNVSAKEEGGARENDAKFPNPESKSQSVSGVPGFPGFVESDAWPAQVQVTDSFQHDDQEGSFLPIDSVCNVAQEKSLEDALNSESVSEERRENSEHKNGSFYMEFSDQQPSKDIPRLYFLHDNIDLPDTCYITSNIYIASSENLSNLANDLCNLPADSIGAIDQENQQLVLFLQSRRVISQFGIFNIINT